MDRYASTDCPICGKPLLNKSIVVCPTCGAPYHRECFFEHGGECIFTDLHEQDKAWEAPVKEEKFAETSELRCSRCGTVNPPTGLFCQVCGNQLNDKAQTDTAQNKSEQAPPAPGFMGGFVPPGMPLNPYTTPFGGVAPDEVIDEIPAKDLAIFVGRNSHYYLPAFKALSGKRTKIINWAAFIFQGGFFLYRKMYLTGILLMLVTFLMGIPNALLFYQTLSATAELSYSLPISIEALTTLNLIFNFASIALRLTCGIFANTVYKSHVYSKIKVEKEKNLPESEYLAALSKKGSVAIKLITGLLVAYTVISVLGLFSMILLGY